MVRETLLLLFIFQIIGDVFYEELMQLLVVIQMLLRELLQMLAELREIMLVLFKKMLLEVITTPIEIITLMVEDRGQLEIKEMP
jgi:Ni/Fe-hydrogenase subunit HybB-like protein